MRQLTMLVAACVFLHAAGPSALGQIAADQVDDFQQGGAQGWLEGAGSPNPPQVIADGGPDGAGDSFLRNQSSGINGPGGRMIVFNTQSRWRGDYLAAGITALEVDLNNLGTTPLTMRFDLVRSNPMLNSESVFTQGFEIQPGSGWQRATFSLDVDDLFSTGNIAAILSDVRQLRLLHEPGPSPSHPPTPVNGILGIDNIRAIGAPVVEGLPGDYNGNGLVEQEDLDLVLANWGEDGTTPPPTWSNDLPDGTIDQPELDGVLANWGNAAPATAVPLGTRAIPEPSAALLWTLGGALAICFRRRVEHSAAGLPARCR